MYNCDTIAAIATPPGTGGVAIIRLSGSNSEQIGLKIFTGKHFTKGGGFESHRLFYGSFKDFLTGNIIDDGFAVLMRAPRSYTAEDVLELHCHGGYLISMVLLKSCVAAGARLAEPGEFTRRAFLNGRIDLTQAEAVMKLISSRSERSMALSHAQLSGRLSYELFRLKQFLVEALALIEAYIDFPDDEVDEAVLETVRLSSGSALFLAEQLLSSFAVGKSLVDGVSILLLGAPNAGKSSLLNSLSGFERAIVSEIPGTTRDLVEEMISLNGIPARLIDAAGIRSHHADMVEKEGVRRAIEKISEADLVLLLFDGSAGCMLELEHIIAEIGDAPYLLVLTKSDLPQQAGLELLSAPVGVCRISSRTSSGINRLTDMIFNYFTNSAQITTSEAVLISSVRHRDILLRVKSALQGFIRNLDEGFPPELLSLDLRSALVAVGEITGETATDDLLDQIFSSFCIGK